MHLATPLQATLAMGKRYGDWMREALALGPIFHAEMGETFVNQRLDLRSHPNVEIEFRLADGRWLRLRESRMADGGQVVLTTDITETKAGAQVLALSEARYRAIVEDMGEFISRLDENLNFTFVNRAYVRQIGKDAKAIIGTSVLDLMDEAQRTVFKAQLSRLTPERPTAVYTMEAPLPDASRGFEEWTDRALFDADDSLLGYQSIGRDITQSQRDRQELAASEDRFRTIADGVPLPIVITHLDDPVIMFANPRAREVFGIETGLAASLESIDALWDSPGERKRVVRRVRKEGRLDQAEVRMRDGRGRVFDALLSVCPIRYAGRDAVLGAITDISAQRRAEAALTASEQRFKAIAELHPVPMNIVRTADHALLYANRACQTLFGYDLASEDADLDRDLLYVDPSHWAYIFAATLRDGRLDDHEVTMRHRDGTSFPVSVRTQRMEYDGDDVIVLSFADLTKLKAAEAEIVRGREALHQSEKLGALGSLLAGVAHELNNPLSIVTGYASMLKDTAADPRDQAWAGKVHAAAERCVRIVRAFLAMARSEPRGKTEIAIDGLAVAALEMLAYGLRGADIEVETDFAPNLPPIIVDADHLHQVLANLILNAQQAMQSVPLPRVLRIATALDDGFVSIRVADTGPGVPDAIKGRIFDPFFTTKPVGVGTGIGLSVSRGMVLAHGGTIDLADRPGGGSVFTVRLPLGGTGKADPVREGLPRRDAHAQILVIDDEADLVELIAETLDRDGHCVTTAASGREALALIESRHFDLVLSDLRMPDIDGPTLYGLIKERRPEMVGRIAFMTGDVLGGCTGLSSDEVPPLLEKPVGAGALCAFVAERLDLAPEAS